MKRLLLCLVALATMYSSARAQEVFRLGIIGLDTSHSVRFSELLNAKDSDDPFVRRFEVVAAYPYGTTTIESASSRIPKYIEEVQKYGVKVVGSIREVLDQVDGVFIETNDGRLHLEQAIEVFKSGKKVFIDKPMGATLGETIAIFKMAEKYGVKTFSSSSLRFSKKNQELRDGVYGEVWGADCYSPHSPEPTHPDFGYYGIHGVEMLYTVMGTGCEKVSRIHNDSGDVVTGTWDNGRLGTFRALVGGSYIYGGNAFFKKGPAVPVGGNDGYKPLLDAILTFFDTGVLPVTPEETIELFAFMKASNMSLERGGKYVTIAEAMKVGEKDAKKLIKKYDKKK